MKPATPMVRNERRDDFKTTYRYGATSLIVSISFRHVISHWDLLSAGSAVMVAALEFDRRNTVIALNKEKTSGKLFVEF